MDDIFTRAALDAILCDDGLTAAQRAEQLMALYRQARQAAEAAPMNEATSAQRPAPSHPSAPAHGAATAQKAISSHPPAPAHEATPSHPPAPAHEATPAQRPAPDPRDSAEYRALEDAFAAYRAMQEAREDQTFAAVKPKFFETVYAMLDLGEGADSTQAQLERIRGEYEEYFLPAPPAKPPVFGAATHGSMPLNRPAPADEFMRTWGFGGSAAHA